MDVSKALIWRANITAENPSFTKAHGVVVTTHDMRMINEIPLERRFKAAANTASEVFKSKGGNRLGRTETAGYPFFYRSALYIHTNC